MEVAMSNMEASSKRSMPMSLTGASWPSWRWLDDIFRDGEMHQMIKIEQSHEGDSMVIRAELPGVDPDKDIDIEVIDGALVISAEKTESHEKSEHNFYRSEFRYGSLTRSVPIPSGVDASTIDASYKDGVLEVRMAMPSNASNDARRRIMVKRA
jgi:HSP20 family protein